MAAGTAGVSVDPAFRLGGSLAQPSAAPPPNTDSVRPAEELCRQRRFREALGVLNRLVLSEPRNPAAWTLMATAHLGRGEYAEALTAARSAEQYTCGSEPLRMATSALVALERYEEAAEQAVHAVRREPHDWRNHVAHARALVKVPDRIAEARSAARAAVNIAPHKVTPHLVAGEVEMAAGDVEAAAKAFRQVFTIDAANPTAYNELARLHLRGGSKPRTRRWPLPPSRREH